MSLLKFPIVPAVALVALVGCQAVYPTQFVPYSPLTTEYKNDSYNFRVVDLTPASAMEANQLWAYTPRATPLGLRSDAAPAAVSSVMATTQGRPETSDSYLIAQVSQNVETVSSAEDLRDPPPSPARPYRIGVGDVFTITIEALTGSGANAFQTQSTVDYAGNIFVTDVGEVQVLDQTVAEARQTIADRFRDARLSSSGSATVTGFNSQKVLVSSPGRPTSFLPITNTPVTLRDAYLQNSSGIDRDAQRQIVVLRRDGQNYAIGGIKILRQTYGYDVFLRDGDEIQIFDRLLNEYDTAAVSGDVLALRRAEFEREEAERAQQRFEAEERRADETARFARESAVRAEQQLEIARLNAQLAQSGEQRARLEQARADRDEARRVAAEARAEAADARARAAEARAQAAESRNARQLALAELDNARRDRQLAIAELGNSRADRTLSVTERNSARDLAEKRIDLGIEGQDRIFVAGEVGKQQTVPLPFDRHYTLAEAVYAGNGIQPITGDPSRIYVVRVKSSVAGTVESYIFHFDGGNLANTPAMTMFQMRPDDYVLVMPRAITNWSRFITQLVPTFNSLISAARVGATGL